MSAAVLLMVLVTAAVVVWPGRRSAARPALDRVLGAGPEELGDERIPVRQRLSSIAERDPVELLRAAWLQRRALRSRPGAVDEEDVLSLLDAIEPALRAGLSPARAFELAASGDQGVVAGTGSTPSATEGSGARSGVAKPARLGSRTEASADAGTLGGLVAAASVAAASGASVGRVWQRFAEEADSGTLRFVASAWQLSERTGAPLADAVARAAARTRAELSRRRRTSAAVAGPRATVNILTALPLIGPLYGLASGLDPTEVYLSSPLVLFALAVGLALLVVGRWWCRRLVDRVLGPA